MFIDFINIPINQFYKKQKIIILSFNSHFMDDSYKKYCCLIFFFFIKNIFDECSDLSGINSIVYLANNYN